MKDIFMKREGKISCKVTEHTASLTKIWWEDEDGNTLVTLKPTKTSNIQTLSLDITYDEWSLGRIRNCFVEHSQWMEPVKKTYERSVGKAVSIIMSSNNLSVPL